MAATSLIAIVLLLMIICRFCSKVALAMEYSVENMACTRNPILVRERGGSYTGSSIQIESIWYQEPRLLCNIVRQLKTGHVLTVS